MSSPYIWAQPAQFIIHQSSCHSNLSNPNIEKSREMNNTRKRKQISSLQSTNLLALITEYSFLPPRTSRLLTGQGKKSDVPVVTVNYVHVELKATRLPAGRPRNLGSIPGRSWDSSLQTVNLVSSTKFFSYPSNRLWRPIGFWEVEDPTFYR
jgi:hypothetical protein